VLLILLNLIKVETRYIDILFLLLILSIPMYNFFKPVKQKTDLWMDKVVKLYEKVLSKYMNRMNKKYKNDMNFLYEDLNPDKFIECIKHEYEKYKTLLNINLSLGYYFKGDIKFLCGDFNLLPTTEHYRKIAENWNDTYFEGKDLENKSNLENRNLETQRIDYIMAKKGENYRTKQSFFINDDSQEWTKLSDHLPYMAVLEIE